MVLNIEVACAFSLFKVGRILGKTTQAVDVGRRIVAAMEDVNRDLGRDDNLRAPVVAQLVGVDDTTQELREATEMANTALDTADTEVNEVRKKWCGV